MTAARFMVGLVVCSALANCSIDDRQLQTNSSAPGAGSPASAGAFSGDAAGASAAGKSGVSSGNDAGSPALADAGSGGLAEPPAPPIPSVGGCADLDQDGMPDCQQTLLANAAFQADVAHWQADSGASLTWDPRDALDAHGSGTALLSAASSAFDAGGSSLVTAGQCVAVPGGQIVIAYANALVDDNQDPNGRAAVNVDFYDTSNCTGMSTSSFSTPQPLDAHTGVWLTLKAALLTSNATHSARVMLAIEKPFQAQSFHARFDNVLLETRPAQ